MSDYYKSSGKSKKVTCRVTSCKQVVQEQNYSVHLNRNHPEEDSRDLRGASQESLSYFRISSMRSALVVARGSLQHRPGGTSADGHGGKRRSGGSPGTGDENDGRGGEKGGESSGKVGQRN